MTYSSEVHDKGDPFSKLSLAALSIMVPKIVKIKLNHELEPASQKETSPMLPYYLSLTLPYISIHILEKVRNTSIIIITYFTICQYPYSGEGININ